MKKGLIRPLERIGNIYSGLKSGYYKLIAELDEENRIATDIVNQWTENILDDNKPYNK